MFTQSKRLKLFGNLSYAFGAVLLIASLLVNVFPTSIVRATAGGFVPVTLCHGNGNGTYEEITVDNQGALNGHLNHQVNLGDIIPAPADGCPTEEEPILGCTDADAINYDPAATEDDGNCEYPLVDVCSNIEGDQESVPEGYELVDDECVLIEIPVDVCSNIEGDQESVPEGYEFVDDACVLIEPPDDPFALGFYCTGFSVENLNAFATSFGWSIDGGPSGVASIEIGETVNIDVNPSLAGALVSIAFNQEPVANGYLPEDCSVDFITLQAIGVCNNSDITHAWRVINPNPFEVQFEWRINGSTLAGLQTVAANSNVAFETAASEGSILMVYFSGDLQGNASAVTGCVVVQETPESPDDPKDDSTPVVIVGTPDLISQTQVLIPVTGVGDVAAGLTPRSFLNFGLGFFGLGLVLNGFARRRQQAQQES